MKPQAFTIRGKGLLRSVITPVSMRQSYSLCQNYRLVCQQADVRALWDTGATGSCISKGLAGRLGLKAVDICQVSGVGGVTSSQVFIIDILLPSNVEIPNVRVTEFMDNGIFEIIIGMDIMTLGDFAVSNKDGNTTVSFRIPPSDDPIDFVKQIEPQSK
ncbi:MAG: retroviral-like aspartic protease family protein [Treponema sp.]|nr:retroviral-like aspartic protease family protein [Treponema sp.]